MNVLLFSMAIIIVGILLLFKKFGTSAIIPTVAGQVQANPFYFSGNPQQKKKKHNMLRISKLRRK